MKRSTIKCFAQPRLRRGIKNNSRESNARCYSQKRWRRNAIAGTRSRKIIGDKFWWRDLLNQGVSSSGLPDWPLGALLFSPKHIFAAETEAAADYTVRIKACAHRDCA